MRIRDWSAARLAVVWLAWFSLLALGLFGALALLPDGLTISVSPANVRGWSRWMLVLVGVIVLFFPPLLVTYVWYLARLREWSERTPSSDQARRGWR